MSSVNESVCGEINLLLKTMFDLFQMNQNLQSDNILKLKRNDDEIWVPVCETIYGKYDYVLAMRLKKRWIDNHLSLKDYEPMDIASGPVCDNSEGAKIKFMQTSSTTSLFFFHI